jgi:glycerate kinase
VKLEDRLKGADLCITGEGRLDGQSLGGKAAIGVARLCKRMGVRCVALVGSVGEGAEGAIGEGVTSYFSICDGPMEVAEAMERGEELLANMAGNVGRLVNAGPKTGQ